jgi:EAL domain-containing protein (putative c-di-GMP-specific phosphodiesterase class I)
LHKIPFSELKVDQSFVLSMLYDDEARAIVKTCIVLGHELNMEVVAEGVETKAHFELLKSMGCDIAQGYYFSKAVPPSEMEAFYQKHNTLERQLLVLY